MMALGMTHRLDGLPECVRVVFRVEGVWLVEVGEVESSPASSSRTTATTNNSSLIDHPCLLPDMSLPKRIIKVSILCFLCQLEGL
jgi:hypothetical protein